jgi:branched-chain amino acid transport system permease protein
MIGGLYALIATGFVIVYNTSKVLNFSHGELVMLGAFLTYAGVTQLKIPFFITIPIVIVIMIGISFLVERLILRPLVGRSSVVNTIMVTLGLGYVLVGITRIIWGSQPLVMPSVVPLRPLQIGDFPLPPIYILCFGILVVVLIALFIFFNKSLFGIAMRAVSNDEVGSYTIGINIPVMFIIAWSLAGIIAGFGGILLANLSVLSLTVKDIIIGIFPVVILGGLESVKGAVIAGFIIGLLTSLTSGYIDPLLGGLPISQILPVIMLLIIILVYPYGLFGIKEIERL